MKRIAYVLLLALLSSAVASAQSAGPRPGGVRSDMVVSTDWLSHHLSDAKLVLVHVGSRANDYRAGHIPGARYLAMDKIAEQHNAPGTELLPPDQLKANLEAIGISNDSRVVIYSPDWDPMATRLYFTLDYLGIADHAALLDGGIEQWMHEKRPTSTEEPKVTPGTLTIHVRPEVVAKMDWVKKVAAEGDPKIVLVDSRPLKRYRAGHLAGAVPMYWETTQVSQMTPVLRSPEELRNMFAAAGAVPGKKVVSYCEVGLQASYTYFLARYLGLDAAMYDGSYSEWSAANQPAIRGDSPR